MLQRTALTVILFATCAVCLSLVWAQTHRATHPKRPAMLASQSVITAPPT